MTKKTTAREARFFEGIGEHIHNVDKNVRLAYQDTAEILNEGTKTGFPLFRGNNSTLNYIASGLEAFVKQHGDKWLKVLEQGQKSVTFETKDNIGDTFVVKFHLIGGQESLLGPPLGRRQATVSFIQDSSLGEFAPFQVRVGRLVTVQVVEVKETQKLALVKMTDIGVVVIEQVKNGKITETRTVFSSIGVVNNERQPVIQIKQDGKTTWGTATDTGIYPIEIDFTRRFEHHVFEPGTPLLPSTVEFVSLYGKFDPNKGFVTKGETNEGIESDSNHYSRSAIRLLHSLTTHKALGGNKVDQALVNAVAAENFTFHLS